MICKNDICCPVCRALCCVFNESDTCMKFTPGEAPGYDCPDFLCRKDESKRQFYETYSEMLRHGNASFLPTILVLDDLD